MEEEINNINNINNVKKITIVEETKLTKKIKNQKEKKKRVETKTWGLNEETLHYEMQFKYLNDMDEKDKNEKDEYVSKLKTHIKTKLCSYKHQDILKKKFDETLFVSFNETIQLLKKSQLKCCYCSDNIYILYEHVRENKQWSLDRINNDIGHNSGNLVIACLECNLKRRRTNKDAFMFTKNMVIVKT
jgi:hypothetical protein